MKDKPFFADSSIVGDYTPLIRYWELLKKEKRNIDDALLKPSDFKHVEQLIKEQGRISLAELLEKLTEYFYDRIDPEIATRALEEAYNVETELEYARRIIARIMAGWLIEASNTTGILRLRIPWKRD